MTDIMDYVPDEVRSPRYAVRLGADRQPHMFRYEWSIFFSVPEDNSTWLERTYISGTAYFDYRLFGDWFMKPREITDTFDMFGRSWIVIDKNFSGLTLKCVPETTYSHSLALYMLLWYQDMGLWLYSHIRPLAQQLPDGGILL